MRNNRKKQMGITLIALVVTIIVLLILAGIAILMLSGDNGILNKAAEAKTKTEKAKVNEEVRIATMEAATNLKGTIHTETVTSLKTGHQEVNVPIQAGFALSPREGEQSIETGLVVVDTNGNEYVWIPVLSTEQINGGVNWSTLNTGLSNKTITEDSSEYYTAIKNALETYTSTFKTGVTGTNSKDEWYGTQDFGYFVYKDSNGNIKYYTNGNIQSAEEYNRLYNKMLKSVYKNGGFYIGRYEMGKTVVSSKEEANINKRTSMDEYISKQQVATTKTITNTAPSIQGMTPPLSKANAIPYNYITQSQAQMLAESLNYKSVTSSLLFGVQWDLVCAYINKFDKNTQRGTTGTEWVTSGTYGIKWGNFKDSLFTMNRGFYSTDNGTNWLDKNTKTAIGNWLCTTGASDQNSSLNIYDFGGNLSEFTLEKYNDYDDICSSRGGTYSSFTSFANVDGRGNRTLTCSAYYERGARCALFW